MEHGHLKKLDNKVILLSYFILLYNFNSCFSFFDEGIFLDYYLIYILYL
jgi:hypothetical protein